MRNPKMNLYSKDQLITAQNLMNTCSKTYIENNQLTNKTKYPTKIMTKLKLISLIQIILIKILKKI